MTEETLFELAVRTPVEERMALLDRACLGKPDLRARVEALLQADAGSLLKQPITLEATTGFGHTREFSPPVVVADKVIAGRYTLVEAIGEGGMGEVWVARQSEPVKRRVAIKLIKAGMDSKAVIQRFEQERQALALMDHPHIAKVLDGGLTEERHPFFVMELVNGLPLNKFCDEAKLDVKSRLELFVPICQAVQHAHQKGIIHRDLKPNNILVTIVDGKPIPKIIDFGVAKATSGRITEESLSTQFGAVVGTLEYMSPEQAGFSGMDVDTRADIYSLGVLLYELLTGLRPLDAARLKSAAFTEMIRIIKEEEPSKPSTRVSTDASAPSMAALRHTEPRKLATLLRGELDWMVMKCLEKQRDRRYETANALVRDIQRYLADEPVEARPPSASYRLRKFLVRHQKGVIAAGLVFTAVLLGLAGTLYGLWEARLQTHLAREEAQAKEQARQDEATAKAQAQARAVQLEKGNALLSGIFTDIDIRRVKESREPLEAVLGKRLAEAGQQLEGSAIGDLQTVASLQNQLALSLFNLGQYPASVALLEKCRSTYTRLLGKEHAQTLSTMASLGEAYRADGKYDQAIPLLEGALTAQKSTLGLDHPQTINTMGHLAETYKDAGKLDQALPLFLTATDLAKSKLGVDHADTLAYMGNLGLTYRALGKLTQALPLLEEAYQRKKARFGTEHADTLTAMNNLATAYHEAGDLMKAQPLMEETFTQMKARMGSDHPTVLAVMNNLATNYEKTNKFDKALPLFEESLKFRKAKHGTDHPDTLTAMNNLALAYRNAGKSENVVALLEETLALLQKKVGPHHPNTLSCMNNLAAVLLDVGRRDRALPLFQESLNITRTKMGPDHPSTLRTQNNLAMLYWMDKQNDKALPLMCEALKLMENKLGRTNAMTLNSVKNLGVIYKDVGKLKEAIPLMEEAYLAGKKDVSLRGVNLHLLEGYAKAGDQAKFTKLLNDEIAEARSTLAKESAPLAGQLTQIGSTLVKTGHFTEAETLLREALSIREAKEPNTWSTFNTMSVLGGVLLGQKKYADAEPLLLKGYQGMKAREKSIPVNSHSRLTEAVERLILLYTALGKQDELNKWQAEKAKR
jgi:eukaryotic-like serine/threonine-protein kinase